MPHLWLLSDARNDAALEEALERLPEGSGFIFRHYHLEPKERCKRWQMLRSICRSKKHLPILSGDADIAAEWQADGFYGPPARLKNAAPMLRPMIRIATAHDEAEIAAAGAAGADAIMLSPVFATRSHPEADTLGPDRFHALAATTDLPVIALGGMSAGRAAEHSIARWAAIDGLS